MRIRHRLRRRLAKALFWGTFSLLTFVGVVFGVAYRDATDSKTLSGLIKALAPRYVPGARLEMRGVRVRPFIGEVELKDISLRQTIDGAPCEVLNLPWLRIRHDPRALLKRQFIPREVIVTHPTLKLRRRADGTWNIQGLLADPWPGPPMKGTPPIVINNGTVQLWDAKTHASEAILREVAIRIEPDEDRPTLLKFEGSATSELFNRLDVKGTFDPATGEITLAGDVGRLLVSETLRARLPAEARPLANRLGLVSGEVDLQGCRVSYDPGASPPFHYEGTAHVHSGVWACPKLPFPIDGLSAHLSVRDGVLDIERAEGYSGPTTVRIEKSRFVLGDPARAPFDVEVKVSELELDQRLRDKTPPEFADLWGDFRPSGRISAAIHVVRERDGGPVGYAWTVDCRDVAMLYRYFKYPVDHIRGSLKFEKKRITLDLRTVVGNKPLTAWGTIDNPGPDAHVHLDFRGDALPIDKTLFDALPPPIRTVVAQFQPTGTVRGLVTVDRKKRVLATDPPEGRVAIDAHLDLNERCGIKWAGLPYPVDNLTGHLELHPDNWIFTDMRGSNGQAVITGDGRVEKLPGPGDPLKVDLELKATDLPFNNQLRSALPQAWQKTWATLNPVGSSNVDATIRVAPGREHYHLVIDPQPQTSVRLEFTRASRPGVDPGGTFDLLMENVTGRFIYDDGPVEMRDVGFLFHGTPVRFDYGKVKVEDSGRFDLGVTKVWASHFRMDSELRKIMPPVMAQFAQRLDEGRPIATIKGNLGLRWEGPGRPVHCDWNDVLVVLNDNAIQAGLPLEHLQGQLEQVRGRFNGEDLAVDGVLRLDSVSLLGQQVTDLVTAFHVDRGRAQLGQIRGKLLGGSVAGEFGLTLDATPRYAARLALDGADLRRYAETLPGRQTFRGLVNGRLDLNGLGNDIHTLEGQGEAHVINGDLGELPMLLRLLKKLNLTAATKTAFDSADVAITIRNGESRLDPIRLTGNAFSLLGQGTLGPQGDLDLTFKPLYGRDRVHVPVFSDVVREASGQLFVIRAQGPIAYPRFRIEPLPRAANAFRSMGTRRAETELR